MNKDIIEEYCSGCGLCVSEYGAKFSKKSKFNNIDIESVTDYSFSKICPASKSTNKYLEDSIWGPIRQVYGGWSVDSDVRHMASSGGVLTAISKFLLEEKIVDGIIQTRKSPTNPTKTITQCSTTYEDVLECIGSRYSESSPLISLKNLIEDKKKYAFIGRPCDVLALRKFIDLTGKYRENIIYSFSFFCAGTPSNEANSKLVTAMGSHQENLSDFNYRGNGWPGYATATEINGETKSMKYSESWSNYLGRDLRPICKFCIDGTGASSDISCGDYWYLKDGYPDFSEHEGRNLIFSRSEKGENLLEKMQEKNKIELIPFDEGYKNIKLIQPAQFERTTTIYDKFVVFKLFGKPLPEYDWKLLKKFSKENSVRRHFSIIRGTTIRVLKHKM